MTASDDAERRTTLLAFGQLLKRLRAQADLTQEELAERAGLSVRSISELERGASHRPRRDTVALLADGLRLRGADRDAFVALARGRPPAAPIGAAGSPAPRALPAPPTQIVGRLMETAAVMTLLLDPATRLVTLTGPGGVGKTRLALEVAARTSVAFPDGVCFVDLTPVRDPALVLDAIAHALVVAPHPERPLLDLVTGALAQRRLLLALDNFEHLPSAAPLVADLLAACPRLTALATSRAPLRIRAERDHPLAPLALPDLRRLPPLDEVAAVPAVELFLRRAEAIDREFALTADNARAVAEIVVRLDGLPLAIELAATWLKLMSPAALLARLEPRLPLLRGGPHDLPERQQAMRATIDWSHDRLAPDEQTLFRRLAVFVGGFSLDAAEWMAPVDGCGETAARSAAGPALDLVAALVDASLVRTHADGSGERRFSMLETIREYGLERLATADEASDVQRRRLAWCLDLAERAEPELTGAEQQRWFALLEREHDNLRAALAWALDHADAEAMLRLGGALYRFWATEGLYEEGSRWLERALALTGDETTVARGNALLGAGVMDYFRGDYGRARERWETSLALFRALGNDLGVAYSYGNLGLVADAEGDYERAIASYEAALTRFRRLDAPTYVGFMLHNLGLIAWFQRRFLDATTLFSEALDLARSLQDQHSVAMTLGNLGLAAFGQGDYERARALHREALELGRRLNNRPWLARGIEQGALLAAATGEPVRAARLFGAAAAERRRFGGAQSANDREISERSIAGARADLGDEAFALAWEAGECLSLEDAVGEALADERQSRVTRGALADRDAAGQV